MASLWQRLLKLFTRKTSTQARKRSRMRRWLQLESLEVRTTMDATISGVVFSDLDNNGLDAGDTFLSGVSVALFRDGGNGTFDNGTGDDIASGTTTSATTTGAYSFTGLTTIGRYFVVQTSAAGSLIQDAARRILTVEVTTVATITGPSIDDFNSPVTTFTADSTGTNPNFDITPGLANVQGTVRDLFANATSGVLTVSVDGGNSNALDLQPSLTGDGSFFITYDGDDTNAANLLGTQLGTGTNNFDLTTGGTTNAIRLSVGTETIGTTVLVRASGVGGTSTTAAIAIPATGAGPLVTLDIPFSSFTGTADLTQIGALQFEINQDAGQDTQIDSLQLIGPTVFSGNNLANITPMTIGDLVFLDRNNDGTFNGTDSGINNVTVRLYTDTNNNGLLDTAEVTAQTTPTTTTTNATGNYTFTGLLPGSYIVLIPTSEFATGQELANHITSPGAGPVDTNNEDQGATSGTNGVAAAIVLASLAEPTNDGDTDANTNLTVDFGFTNTVLALAKTDNPDPVTTGGQLTYTLTATNNGPSDATNVVITDPLPTGLTLVTATYTVNGGAAQAASNTAGTITTGTFNLSAGQQAVLTIVSTVGATFVNNTVNTGSVVSTEVTTPVTATATTSRNPDIDLGISKTIVGGATTVGLGGTFSYRLTLTNTTATTVTGIEVTDNLPPNFNPGTLPAGVALDTTTADPNDLIWSIATIAGLGTATVDIPITVATTATLGSTTNTATIDVSTTGLAGFNDTNPNNNTSSVPITVEPRYDLRVTKTNNLTALTTGQTFTYTLQAINDGPSSATNVTISDTLPSTLEFISSTAGSATGQAFTANVGTLASGATSTAVNVVVRVRSSATGANIANTASVAADTPAQESNGNNNTATDTDPLTRTVTLNVNKDDSVDPVALGANFNYIVTAFNSGTADTANTLFTDVLPTGVEFVSGTFTVNEAVARTGTVAFNTTTRTATATLGTLLPGSATSNQATITLVVRASTTATPGTVTNTAQLTSDDNTVGVTNSETTQLVGLADLSGRVYVDANRNGLFDAGEAGVPNVTINLTGTTTAGLAVNQTATTDANGAYTFNDLTIGTYTIVQVQPANYRSSATNVGTINGVATGTGTENQIATINLTADSIANNFGELLVRSKRLFLSSTTA